MNTKNYLFRWGSWSLITLTLWGLILSLRGEGAAQTLVPGEPVWGRKPVLAYFALTPSLADDFQIGTGLTSDELEIVREIAREEADQLRELERAAQRIVDDETLTELEKKVRIAESGFNEAVIQTLTSTHQNLENALPSEALIRLIAWIERQWSQERARHGILAVSQAPEVARTYTVFATHFDSNGSYTVALPDKCVKFSDGGNAICAGSGYTTGNYSVQLSYDGETTTVQTFDSGPWNVDDNFWAGLRDPHPRRLYTDLPVGMPEAQAAYFDDYNDGRDQYDRIVTAPFAIDLGDGVGSDLGLPPGFNDWIEVVFNWTDGWDAWNVEVITLLKPTNLQPPYTGDMCVTAWHRIFPDLLEGGEAAYLTLNVNDPVQSTNAAEWKPDIPVDGEYLVRSFIPNHGPIDWLCPNMTINYDTSDAEYTIHHANGQTTVSKNQGPMANQYLELGTFEFEAGEAGKVALSDLNDEANLSHTVAFSAMQFRQVLPPPTPSPTPSPTPPPTPVPEPLVFAEARVANPGTSVDIAIHAGSLQLPGLGQAVIDVQFNPDVITALACQPDPNGLFDLETCLPGFDADGIFPDTARITLHSAGGLSGSFPLAILTFQTVGLPSSFTWLDLGLGQFMQPDGSVIPAELYKGMVCLAPCENVWFVPLIVK